MPRFLRRAALGGLPLLAALAAASCMALHEELPPGVEGAPAPNVHTASRAEVATAQAATPAPHATLARARPRTAESAPFDAADDEAWAQLRAAAAGSVAAGAAEGWPADDELSAKLEGALAAAATSFAAPDATALGELLGARLELPAEAVPGGGVTRVRAADVTGDGQDDLLVAVPAAGVPLFALVRADDGWSTVRLPATGSAGYPQLGEAADADGDGTDDVVYTTHVELPEHTVTDVRVARWSGDGFDELLAAPLDDWSGPAASNELWSMETADGRLVVQTRCGAEGAFDDRFLEHQEATRTYAWDPATERFALASREASAPTSARQAANVGEAALRAGDLEAAQSMYEQVAAGDYPLRDATDVDWSALAHFRLAQIYAMSGRAAQARIASANVASGGGFLADEATAFVDSFAGVDSPRALAATWRAFLQPGPAPLAAPLTTEDLAWPGLVLADWVRQRGADTLGEEPETTLNVDLQVDVADAAWDDLDGDGGAEVLAALPAVSGEGWDLWLATDKLGAVAVHRLGTAEDITLGEAVDLNPGRGVPVTMDGTAGLWTWDGRGATLVSAEEGHAPLAYAPDLDPRVGHEACSVR